MVELEPTSESPARARAAISTLRDRLDPRTYAELELLVSELVTNAVRHAGLAPDDPIQLEVFVSGERLRAEVIENGVGFNPSTPHPAPDGSSGWGLYIAERVADRWGVKNAEGMTRVWAEWDLARRN
jgi:anti-sigma regulatory factor (Ser/Thr protein kinase)